MITFSKYNIKTLKIVSIYCLNNFPFCPITTENWTII